MVFKENSEVKKEDTFQKVTNSRIAGVLFLCLSSVLIYNVVKSIVITSQKLEILNQAENEVSELRLTNLELLSLSEYMSSDEYLETEARNRLNLSKKGETSFVISEKVLEKGKAEVQKILEDDDSSEDHGGNFKVWEDFFANGI